MSDSPDRRTPSSRKAAILKGIRRAHLYCGLVMLPWVLLYAVSGLLFNHPSLSGTPDIHRFTREQLPDDLLAPMPAPQQSAAELTERLQQQVPQGSIELLAEPPASYTGSLGARGTQPGKKVRVFLSMDTGNGAVRVSADEPKPVPDALADVEAVELESLDPAMFEQMARSITAQHVDVPEDMTLSSAPKLRMAAQIDGEPWIVEYDPKAKTFEYERVADAESARLPRILARLHMTHVYPSTVGVRWFHALVVDLTILCLMLWCITGLVMWWQIRRLRRIGWVVMMSGLAATTWLLVLAWPRLAG